MIDEVGLSHPGIARDQHERATPEARLLERLLEPASLIRSPDKDAASGHAPKVRTAGGPEDRRRGTGQVVTVSGSGRTTTVSATGTISSAGIPERSACALIASGLSPW